MPSCRRKRLSVAGLMSGAEQCRRCWSTRNCTRSIDALLRRSRAQISLGHLGPVAEVAIERARPSRTWRGDRLGDVVEQHAERQRLRAAGREVPKAQHGVYEHVAFGVVIRRLLAAFHGGDLRQHVRQQPGLVEQLERPLSPSPR